MTTLHHFEFTDSLYGLSEALNRYYEAGVDPAFDGDMEELERQFAECRFTRSPLTRKESLMNLQTTEKPLIDLDYHVEQLLAKQGKIAVIWSSEDVQAVRPNLSEDQAWEVLQAARDKHDANCGIGWDMFEILADEMFPDRRLFWKGDDSWELESTPSSTRTIAIPFTSIGMATLPGLRIHRQRSGSGLAAAAIRGGRVRRRVRRGQQEGRWRHASDQQA